MCTCFFHAGFFFIIRIDFNMIGHVPCEISKKKEKKAEKQTKTNMLENVFVYVSFGTAHLLILINILVRKYRQILNVSCSFHCSMLSNSASVLLLFVRLLFIRGNHVTWCIIFLFRLKSASGSKTVLCRCLFDSSFFYILYS